MCRNIKPLFNFEPPASQDEIVDAARQFVRKVTGYPAPSAANRVACDRAIDEIAGVCERLFAELTTNAAPRDRVVEAEKRRQRSAERFRQPA